MNAHLATDCTPFPPVISMMTAFGAGLVFDDDTRATRLPEEWGESRWPPRLALLAGGLATRLRPLTSLMPKSLIQVAGEPFLASSAAAHPRRRDPRSGASAAGFSASRSKTSPATAAVRPLHFLQS